MCTRPLSLERSLYLALESLQCMPALMHTWNQLTILSFKHYLLVDVSVSFPFQEILFLPFPEK